MIEEPSTSEKSESSPEEELPSPKKVAEAVANILRVDEISHHLIAQAMEVVSSARTSKAAIRIAIPALSRYGNIGPGDARKFLREEGIPLPEARKKK
jgi:hypothetical protein